MINVYFIRVLDEFGRVFQAQRAFGVNADAVADLQITDFSQLIMSYLVNDILKKMGTAANGKWFGGHYEETFLRQEDESY